MIDFKTTTVESAGTVIIRERGFVTRVIQEKDIQEAAICFAESFQREPMVAALNVTLEQFIPFAEFCCAEAARTGMGVVIEDEITGDVAGFALLSDAIQEPVSDALVPENLIPCFALLDTLLLKYIDDKEIFITGEVCVTFAGGAKKKYEGKGLGLYMMHGLIEIGKRKGYHTMISEVSGRFSQNLVGRRFKFSTHSKIAYHDFEFDGERVFQSIPDKKLECVLMERNLSEL